MTEEERSKIADVVVEKPMAEGEEIVKEGEQGDTFYIVSAGQCEARTAEKGAVMVYDPADFFGELALQADGGGLRQATVVCTGAGTLLCVQREIFERLIGPLEGLTARKTEYK